jgi:hypothetical protein
MLAIIGAFSWALIVTYFAVKLPFLIIMLV